MRPIRLVIADRRPIVLQGFATLFAAERDFAIVASCLDGAGCLKAVRKLTPDVVLVEDGFSDVTASEMLAVVKAENIPTRLVFYTASLAHGDLAAAIAAGACCAISMREKPKNLMQTLKLVAPTHDRATANKEEDGALDENGLTALTDQERKIMRLVACGMSNKQIARQLKVSTSTIKARLDHISTQLEIKGRREVAAFALSRLYGGIGALAALILAALDDAKAADTSASGHESTDAFAVMTADGTGEIITIKINAKKTAAAWSRTAKALFKPSREENSITEASRPAGKPIQSSIDISPGTITLPALNSARPGLGSYSTFMTTAVGIWFYELLNSVAQASNPDHGLAVFAPATGSGTGELAAVNSLGSANANFESFDSLAWLHPEANDQSFSFAAPGSDLMARDGDDLQIVGAYADGDSVSSNGNPHVGSGAVDALIDHGGFEQAAATDAPAGDESNHGQSQHDLHAAQDGGAAAKQHEQQNDKQHDKDVSPEDDSAHGQSQRDFQEQKHGTVAATQHSKHEVPKDDANLAQQQRDKHDLQDNSAAAGHHAKDDAGPASGANPGQSQRELHAASANDSKKPHAGSSQQAGDKDQSADGSGQAHKAAAPELGDSFHFKNDNAASAASHVSEIHGDHGPASNEHGLHTGADDGLTPVQDAELTSPSHPEQSAVDHAKGAAHHLTHDLFV